MTIETTNKESKQPINKIKLKALKVQNFKSIKDTGWINFSQDNITCLVGQNESGKTSFLEALNYFFNKKVIDTDHIRKDRDESKKLNRSKTMIACSFGITYSDLEKIFSNTTLPSGLKKIIDDKKRINIKAQWDKDNVRSYCLEGKNLQEVFDDEDECQTEETNQNTPGETNQNTPGETNQNTPGETNQNTPGETNQNTPGETNQNTPGEEIPSQITAEDFIDNLIKHLPKVILFADNSLLPNTIDIEDIRQNNLKAEGYIGAINFMKIHNLDLTVTDTQSKKDQMETVNREANLNFLKYWKQKIGKSNQIKIEVELKNYDATHDKRGQEYLQFWIRDGDQALYPRQRSHGVRWFVSFYLQLKANEKANKNFRETIILIDEPAGQLHDRAKKDVLKVFEDVKEEVTIIYTTHSHCLINIEDFSRILAVQRSEDGSELHNTKIFTHSELAQTNTDTLFPIYSAMGTEFHSAGAIKKHNNIIVEEISAHYYFRAFLKLTKSEEEVHFIPASGVTNIHLLARIFLANGVFFSIIMDDDKAGKNTFKNLKKELALNDGTEMIKKIKDCKNIENIFSEQDRKKFLNKSNDNYGKAVIARGFLHKVKSKEVTIEKLENTTEAKIIETVGIIKELLQNQKKETEEKSTNS